jgi:hypothetical protein
LGDTVVPAGALKPGARLGNALKLPLAAIE